MEKTKASLMRGKEIEKRTYGGAKIIEKNEITEPYKNLFIHIPKTGGIAVKDSMVATSMFSDHYFASDVREELKGKDVFLYTFLRNPYARIVSIYEAVYRATAGETVWEEYPADVKQHAPAGYKIHPDKSRQNKMKSRPVGVTYGKGWGDTLDYLPTNLYFKGPIHDSRMQAAAVLDSVEDYKTANMIKDVIREELTFEMFIDIIVNEVWHVWWEPQTSFIFDENDKVIVDYVGNTNSLQQNLFEITQYLGKKLNKKINVPPLRQLNQTIKSRPSYKEYFKDANTMKAVEKYYEKDFDYLKISKL